MLKILISLTTPYEKLEKNNRDLMKLIPHLESFLNKLPFIGFMDFTIEKSKIDLLLTIGDIYRFRAHRIADSLEYFQKALEINKACKYLNQTSEALVNLKIGEVYTLMSRDDEAVSYLERSSGSLDNNLSELAKNYRLIGVTHMRKNRFREAEGYFEKALAILRRERTDSLSVRIIKSNILADAAFNYFLEGINRNNAPKALEIMKKAVDILSSAKVDENSEQYMKVAGRLIIHKIKLAGIHNALGEYDIALKTAVETEQIIEKLPTKDYNIFYAQGIIARERGLAYLRLNRVKEAYDYFMRAKDIFSKTMTEEYLFRLKMHEAESLIRLNRLDEAFKACQSMFATENRERNNYCDLFFNTCYYHAAVIKYKQGDEKSAARYFSDFFKSMKTLCKNILSREKYGNLVRQRAFEENSSDLKIYFENSLKIFESIYWKDYEFTKYYVEENLKSAR
jgi:tetratricopeptide (TPR) repeat protein